MVLSRCFQGVSEYFQGVFRVFFPVPFPGMPFGPFQFFLSRGLISPVSAKGSTQKLQQGRKLWHTDEHSRLSP